MDSAARLALWLLPRRRPGPSLPSSATCCWHCCRRLFSSTSASSSSSKSRWTSRQSKDFYAREAKVQGLKSRAAFKLMQINVKYRLFKKGQMVVDLGYAPGSWSQVAVELTKPSGHVLGIDLIPAQPPRGVSTIQGNFLSPTVRALVRNFLTSTVAKRALAEKERAAMQATESEESQASQESQESEESALSAAQEDGDVVMVDSTSYLEQIQQTESLAGSDDEGAGSGKKNSRVADIILSDMSEPWPQTRGFWLNTMSNPYTRMMNTSGIPFRDHAGSMDLCAAALEFASDTLRPGGHFVCKFYQGSEDKALEMQLRQMFVRVHREKPESSRNESKEAYFVALRRKGNVAWEDLQATQKTDTSGPESEPEREQ